MTSKIVGAVAVATMLWVACVVARSPSSKVDLDSGMIVSTDDAHSVADTTSPYSEPEASVKCVHPAIKEKCANSWCRIPSGCFWSGSPEGEFGKAATREPLVPITLTRAFVMQQHETTIAEWKSVGFHDPTGDFANPDLLSCKEDDCPVTGISWMEGLVYANAMSVRENLPKCYELIDCAGTAGQGLECRGFKLTTNVSYDCSGYRLPMGAEREYAMRAGTRSAFYSGDIQVQSEDGTCFPDPNLDRIAWWCNNSNGRTHPVGQKMPNGFGLYDMSGNVPEFIIDPARSSAYGESAITDPGDPVNTTYSTRSMRGGWAHVWATASRSASWLGDAPFNAKGDGTGVRLVRTLSAAELDAGAAVRDGAPE
jgi:formylglycine-generating enzyme